MIDHLQSFLELPPTITAHLWLSALFLPPPHKLFYKIVGKLDELVKYVTAQSLSVYKEHDRFKTDLKAMVQNCSLL